MSGTRLTRKVTVEGGKKLPEGGGSNSSSSAGIRRLSVFERLGPGTSDVSIIISFLVIEVEFYEKKSNLLFYVVSFCEISLLGHKLPSVDNLNCFP